MILFFILTSLVFTCDITTYECYIDYFDCRNDDKWIIYDYKIKLSYENISVYTITKSVRESPVLDKCLFTPQYPTCGSLKYEKNSIDCYYCPDIKFGFSLSPNCEQYQKDEINRIIIICTATIGSIGLSIVGIIIYYCVSRNNKKYLFFIIRQNTAYLS